MSRLDRIEVLRSGAPMVLPSMLMCDFGNLEREMKELESAGARGYHLDVMDGEFVPNLTYGMPIVAAMRKLTDCPLDVHLMIAKPERFVGQFIEAGADMITFHAEACEDIDAVLKQIRSEGVAAGVAINPGTPLESIMPYVDDCDAVLAMSVEAGFGGQSFQPVALEKIKALRDHAGDSLMIEIDGGVNQETIASCAKAGTDLFVVGSGIFASEDYESALSQLTALAS